MATKKSTWKVVIIVLVVLAIVGVGVWQHTGKQRC